MKILEVNNIDLIGKSFNGYDFIDALSSKDISVKQAVIIKQCNNDDVVPLIPPQLIDTFYKVARKEDEILSIHSNVSITSPALFNLKEYQEADIIHFHMFHNTRLSLYSLLKICNEKKVVISLHDPWFFTGHCVHFQECEKWKSGCVNCPDLNRLFKLKKDNSSYLWQLKKNIFDKIQIDLIVTSEWMYNLAKSSPITKNQRIHLIPFGVDTEIFSNRIDKEESRKHFGIDENDIVLFFRSQLDFKGTEYIVEALKNLKTDKKITLLTCSEKGNLKEVEDKYNVVELGNIGVDELVNAYNTCDIFLMPSIGESFGMMAIEAMSCEKPIIVFNNTALPSVTKAPEVGVLVNNKDSFDLKKKIEWLLKDDKERKKRGILSRKLVLDTYKLEDYYEGIKNLYISIYNMKNENCSSVNFNDNGDTLKVKNALNMFLCKTFKDSKLIINDLKFDVQKVNIDNIDYSNFAVQEVINQFNNELYNRLINNNTKSKGTMDMKKIIKKIIKSLAKPLLNRFNNINAEINVDRQNIGYLSNKVNSMDSIFKDNISEMNNNNIILKNKMQDMENKIFDIENKYNIINNKCLGYEYNITNNVKNIFYYHGGSGNHGCEALIRTICEINQFDKSDNLLYSYRPKEDFHFKINDYVSNIFCSDLSSNELLDEYSSNCVALSIGGDNYCDYDYGTKKLEMYNTRFNKLGVVTALVGCSIEPDVLEHYEVLKDLEHFSLITARESLTYNALMEKGINKNTFLIPDSAFTLDYIEEKLPDNFIEGKTIGINLSSLAQNYNKNLYTNYVNLIKYIIDKTDYNIMLIPHVVQDFNDDLKILNQLYSKFSHTGRISLVDNNNCLIQKGYIRRCCMFIGARTHATIAAYSSCVPTLALSYSIKSKGIAKDIFGTYDNYTVSIQTLSSDDELIKSFKWLDKNKTSIKNKLVSSMPNYIKRCYELKDKISEIRGKNLNNFSLPNSSDCTGCSACMNVCPVGCIKMVENDKGFKVPNIDFTKCIRCNKCKNICPINKNNYSVLVKKCYAAKANDDYIVNNSSSGGLFTLLAKEIFKKNGVIYGAMLDVNRKEVKHIRVDNVRDLKLINGSKYVQSNVDNIYKQVKVDLDNNIIVLFSGTPCQIIGLKSYLSKIYDNLFCVDVVCHGIPSPLVLKKYTQFLEEKYNSKIKSLNFKNKNGGWSNSSIEISFDNGDVLLEKISDNVYMKSFLNNLILRDSCYNCNFKNNNSTSDITLGDFWGIENFTKNEKFLDNTGVSLVIINNTKGMDLFNAVKSKLIYEEKSYDEAKEYNGCLVKSVSHNPNEKLFWNEGNIEDYFKNNS